MSNEPGPLAYGWQVGDVLQRTGGDVNGIKRGGVYEVCGVSDRGIKLLGHGINEYNGCFFLRASADPATCDDPRVQPAVPVKDSNPKDAIGSAKLDMGLVPSSMVAYAAVSFAEGAGKYGRFNWRVAGVRASVYYAAAMRHLNKWWNGEEADPATGVPHLASALANLGILIDATTVGKLADDRPPSMGMDKVITELEAIVKGLAVLHAAHNPHQYTIKDTQ